MPTTTDALNPKRGTSADTKWHTMEDYVPKIDVAAMDKERMFPKTRYNGLMDNDTKLEGIWSKVQAIEKERDTLKSELAKANRQHQLDLERVASANASIEKCHAVEKECVQLKDEFNQVTAKVATVQKERDEYNNRRRKLWDDHTTLKKKLASTEQEVKMLQEKLRLSMAQDCHGLGSTFHPTRPVAHASNPFAQGFLQSDFGDDITRPEMRDRSTAASTAVKPVSALEQRSNAKPTSPSHQHAAMTKTTNQPLETQQGSIEQCNGNDSQVVNLIVVLAGIILVSLLLQAIRGN
ncbi:hypothetical protein QBC40DRAFT_255776 [Triangularia verruculosa]|uniref:Uncharacterized protein n=1 Tax=Triangularia verruculosa TaxID=2587418 RepID=A0AAN6XJ94_9PEZI|nr:hypothetical protein QBC40DRAFT_255776 [Triangularia verruculosa]